MPLTNRFNRIIKGAMTLIGNNLNINGSNTNDYTTQAYITTDTSKQVSGFPPGTVLDPSQSSSLAILNYPTGSKVLYAELSWTTGGGYPYSNPVTFITPKSTNLITPTLFDYEGITQFYWYGADVTTIVNNSGSGNYTVGNVPGKILPQPNYLPGTSWSLLVIYENTGLNYRYINANTGVSYVSSSSPNTYILTNFITPSSGSIKGYLVMNYTYGDLVDQAKLSVGPSAPGTLLGNTSNPYNGSQPFNRQNNMFPGNICYADCNSPSTIGLLNTTGTFGNNNVNPYAGVYGQFSRVMYDIAGFDISSTLLNNQNSLYVNVTFGPSGQAVIQGESAQIDINSPHFTPVKTVDKNTAAVGDTLNYTVSFTNTGFANANNVIFIDTIPNGLSFINGSLKINGTPTIANPNPPGINLGTIVSNQITTINFQTVVSSIPNPNTANNTSNLLYSFQPSSSLPVINGSDTTNTVTTTISTAILNSSKSVNTLFGDIGDTISYSIVISNTGNVSANSIVFIDTIPNGTTLVAGSLKQDGNLISGNPNYPGVTLPKSIGPGSTSTITFNVFVITLPSPNPIRNSATQIFSYTIDSSTTPNKVGFGSSNTNIVTTSINHANLNNIVKTTDKNFADIGTTITYTVAIINTGSTTANNVMFIDTIPNGTSIVSGSLTINSTTITGSPSPPGVNIGSIPAGASSTVSFKVIVNTIPSSNPVTNSASTTFSYIFNPILGSIAFGSSNSNITSTQINNANLNNITKITDKSFTDVGSTITYTVTIKNTGSTSANNVIFIDTIPNGTSLVSGSLTLNSISISGNPNSPGVNIGTISAGSTSTVSFKVLVNTIPSPNPISNSANTTFSYIVDPSIGTTIFSGSNSNFVYNQINSASFGSITKSSNKQYLTFGDTINYTISIPNTGNVTAFNVHLHETIPNGTVYVPNSLMVNGVTVNDSIGNINVGTIPPGSSSVVKFSVFLTS